MNLTSFYLFIFEHAELFLVLAKLLAINLNS